MSSDYTRSDIVDSLRAVGLGEGDSVFSHSNLGFFGQLEAGNSKKEYCDIFYDAIRDVIGESGTFVVPTFTYSFTDGCFFNPSETESDMGMLSEYIRTHPESTRSSDPNFSVAAIGPNAEYFTKNPPSHSFGKNSFWERFLAAKGKFCNFNVTGITFVHYVEKCLSVPYRWDKPFFGEMQLCGSRTREVFYHFVRDLDNNSHAPDLEKFMSVCQDNGRLIRENLGKGQILNICAQDAFGTIEAQYTDDQSFLISGSV